MDGAHKTRLREQSPSGYCNKDFLRLLSILSQRIRSESFFSLPLFYPEVAGQKCLLQQQQPRLLVKRKEARVRDTLE
jgi:hypothetical protein